MQSFTSHGKLLISGEYVVLDGAMALALPTKFGQTMEVSTKKDPVISWKSYDENNQLWFAEEFSIEAIQKEKWENNDQDEVSKMLFLSLISAAQMNPELFDGSQGFEIKTKNDFPRAWGLGTSSTLLANIAKWAKVDAFKLLEATFGGSGYDIAVALAGSAITFQKTGSKNAFLHTHFNPSFKEQLHFVYLNKKQNSRDSIQDYRAKKSAATATAVEKISNLSQQILTCDSLLEFELLVETHETIISQLTGFKKVKSLLFGDYQGAVKSLGGWGGDFILVTGNIEDLEYFKSRGYTTILSFDEMILSEISEDTF